jgi:hypothetical protein
MVLSQLSYEIEVLLTRIDYIGLHAACKGEVLVILKKTAVRRDFEPCDPLAAITGAGERE